MKSNYKIIVSFSIICSLFIFCGKSNYKSDRKLTEEKYLRLVESTTNAQDCMNKLKQNGFTLKNEEMGIAPENNKTQLIQHFEKTDGNYKVKVKLRTSLSLKTYFYDVRVE